MPSTSARSALPNGMNNEQLQLLQLCFSEHEFGTSDVFRLFDEQATRDDDRQQAAPSEADTTQAPDVVLDYDPFFFIEEKVQHGIPLNAVCKDLSTFERYLQARILQHVHEDVYEAFVSVSGELVGVDEQLSRVYAPLLATKAKVEQAVKDLGHMEASVLATIASAEAHELHRQFHIGVVQALVLYDALCDTVDGLQARPFFKELQCTSSTVGVPPRLPSDEDVVLLQSAVADLFDLETTVRHIVVPPPLPPPAALAGNGDPDAADAVSKQGASPGSATKPQQPETPPSSAALEAELAEIGSVVQDAHQHVLTLLNNTFLAVHGVYVQRQSTDSGVGATSSPSNPSAPETSLLALLKALMQLYTTMGMDDFVVLYRDTVVRSFVENVVTWKAAAAAKPSLDNTAALLEQLCSALERTLLPLASVMRQVFSALSTESQQGQAAAVGGVRGVASSSSLEEAVSSQSGSTSSRGHTQCHAIPLVFWPLVCNTVVTRMAFLFHPGIADAFHRRFETAHRLVALMEAHCTTVSELQALRTSAEMTLWSHKWSVDVYHSLRAQEVRERFQTYMRTLTEQCQTVAAATKDVPTQLYDAPTGQPLRLLASTQVTTLALGLFRQDVFLFPLAHKLLRDAMLCLRDFVRDFSATCIAQLTQEAGNAMGNAPLMALVGAALHDFEWIAGHFIPTELRVAVEAATGEDAATCPPLATVLARGKQMVLASGCQQMQQALIETIATACTAVLSNVRTIKATYSHTKKPMPTSPSWFVSGIFEALSKFKASAKAVNAAHQGVTNGWISTELVDLVCRTVVDDITSKLRDITKETIISARKTEESLGKLRRKREEAKGGGTASTTNSAQTHPTENTASDRDKMVVQLYLDAHEYGSLLRPYGIHKERYTPLQSVLKLCRRAEWILAGEGGPEPTEVEDDE